MSSSDSDGKVVQDSHSSIQGVQIVHHNICFDNYFLPES